MEKKELKAMTEALKKSENRFRNLVETSIDCIWQVNKDWVFEYVSPRSIEIMGYSREEMIGNTLFDYFVSPEGEKEQFLLAGLERRSIRIKELKHKQSEGKLLILEVSANPLYDNDGLFLGYVGTYHDITSSKCNEYKLLAESKRSQLLLRLPLLIDEMSMNDFIFKYLEGLCKITESQLSYTCFCFEDAYKNKLYIRSLRENSDFWQNRVIEMNTHFCTGNLELDSSNFINEQGFENSLSYPLIEQNKINMISGIEKVSRDYSDFDSETLELVSSEIFRIFKAEIQTNEIIESRQKLEEVQKLASLGYWSWNLETGSFEFSRFLSNLFGSENHIKISEIKDLRSYFGERGLVILISHLKKCLNKGEEFILDLAIKNTGRQQSWITIRGIPLYSADNKVKGIYGTIQDISQRIVSEEHMRELAQAVDQSTESIVITDINGDIKYINDTFIKTTGYRLKEVIGLNPRILQSGKTPESTFIDLWKKLISGDVWSGELWNKRKDGSEYIENAIITPLKNSDGSIIGYVGVKEDITEKKQMSQDLDKHRDNLEQLVEERTSQLKIALDESYKANKVKEQFLANMSHEIRTPLNAMMVLLHLLKKTDLNENQIEKIIKIQISGKHLLNIMNNLLDFSKIDSGKLSLESVPFDINSIVQNVKSIMISKAEEKGLKLKLEIPHNPVKVLGDPTRISQALLNLVHNAIKFTEKGEIVIRSKIIKLDSKYLHMGFEIEDNGPGVPEEHIDRLFSPFEQLDSSTTRSHGGSGLGLAITRQLARLMGGECSAASVVGKGSIFWFTACFKMQDSENPDDAESPVDYLLDEKAFREKFTGKTILLVEDDPINQEVAIELLEDMGFIVHIASNGLLAVEKILKRNDYHLIIMDMHMPVMDGLEASIEIRKLKNGKIIPIIAMTGNAFLEDKIHCFDAGMNDIVLKPIDPDELFNTLYKWLDSNPVKQRPIKVPGREREQLHNSSSFDGIDFVQVNKIFSKDMSKFFTLTRSFYQSYNDCPSQCREFVSSGSIKSAEQLIHKMSGAAGTLGLVRIHRVARQIEPLLMTPPVNVEQVISLLNMLDSAFALLQIYLSDQDEFIETREKGELKDAYSLLNQLKALLKNYDTDSQELFNQNKEIFFKEFPRKAELLQKYLEAYDYLMALEIIKTFEQDTRS